VREDLEDDQSADRLSERSHADYESDAIQSRIYQELLYLTWRLAMDWVSSGIAFALGGAVTSLSTESK